MNNESPFRLPVHSWRAATALQLSGVVLIALAARLDSRGIPIGAQTFPYLGILALFVGTLAIVWMVITGRISDRQALMAVVVASAIDITGFIALTPLVQ
jgi:hypothetical protein